MESDSSVSWSLLYPPSLCKPGITVIIRGLKCSLLNLKPKSMNPFTSSSSSSLKLLQLMVLGKLVTAPKNLWFLARFLVAGDDENERVFLVIRFNLLGLSFCFISLSSPSFLGSSSSSTNYDIKRKRHSTRVSNLSLETEVAFYYLWKRACGRVSWGFFFWRRWCRKVGWAIQKRIWWGSLWCNSEGSGAE